MYYFSKQVNHQFISIIILFFNLKPSTTKHITVYEGSDFKGKLHKAIIENPDTKKNQNIFATIFVLKVNEQTSVFLNAQIFQTT